MAATTRIAALVAVLLTIVSVDAKRVKGHDSNTRRVQPRQFGGGVTVIKPQPAYLPVVLSNTNNPLTVPICGSQPGPNGTTVNGTVPSATATLAYVSPPTLGGAFYANMSSDKKSIVLTLIDLKLLPSSFPINMAYGVRDGLSLGVGMLAVTAPPLPKPAGPSNNTVPATPILGFPLAINESEVLAGWSSAGNLSFGLIYAYIKPFQNGVVVPSAAPSGNWTIVTELRQKRFNELTYLCPLVDLRLSSTRVPTATRPPCMSGPSTINFAVADSRYEMTNGTATLKATQAAPVYPWQALDIKGNPTKPRNASAKLGFVLATNGAASAAANASGITWASIGASASVSPPPASATASTMTFPTTPSGGGNGSEATVVITPSAGVTLLGLSMSLPKGAAGLLKLSIELAGPANGSGPAAVTYPLAAPVPVNFNVYAGAGLFGTGYTITKATVSASQVTKGAALTLGAFDASVTPHAPVTLVALPVKRGAGARAARTTSALPAHSRGVAAPARERRP